MLAAADYLWQWWQHEKSLRMTKEEVKQEYRESEGDPLIRGARRRRARQMAFARMMDAVPTSDVIVTNPTTLAVALKYDSLTMRAPKIVAKGQRLMADRIKQIAKEHSVPVIEDKPLARALFSRPVGSEVPAHLYRAVARLLVLVHQARFGAGGRSGGARRGPGAGAWNWSGQAAQGAPGGFAPRPWWSAASATSTAAIAAQDGGPGAFDNAAAARLYGNGPETAGDELNGSTAGAANADATVVDATVVDEDAVVDLDKGVEWLDAAALGTVDVDEEALAAAMADDELGSMTPEELAQLEAGLILGEDSEDSTDVDGEELER